MPDFIIYITFVLAMTTVMHATMANITNYSYTPYLWQKIHTDVEHKCEDVRKRFHEDMVIRKSMLREEIVREYVRDNTLLSIQCIRSEELVALLQWFEMRNDISEVYRSLVFDAICNLWNYLSEYDVRFFSNLPIAEQLEYVAKKKTEFLAWYAKNWKMDMAQSHVLLIAIHMPTYHRVAGHGLLDLMISYLLC